MPSPTWLKLEYQLVIYGSGVGLILAILTLGFFRFSSGPAIEIIKRSEKIPAFYDGVFQPNDLKSKELLLKDPLVGSRGKPLFPVVKGVGPHDLLGFRNWSVPNSPGLITIGDSMTYGNNAVIEENWPSVLEKSLKMRVYNMSVGGWGATQYLYMLPKAATFRPKTIIIAFYTGNDALESFTEAYKTKEFSFLRLNNSLQLNDVPKTAYNEVGVWRATFKSGDVMDFTPLRRLEANRLESEVVNTGYKIMAQIAKQSIQYLHGSGIQLFFTIIPTKELVFSDRIEKERLDAPPDYAELVRAESEHIERLKKEVLANSGGSYLDVITALKLKALNDVSIYPSDSNGHPWPGGYRVIGETVARQLK